MSGKAYSVPGTVNKNQTKHGDECLGYAKPKVISRFIEWVDELTDLKGGYQIYWVRGCQDFYYVTSRCRETAAQIYHMWLGFREGAELQGCMLEGWR